MPLLKEPMEHPGRFAHVLGHGVRQVQGRHYTRQVKPQFIVQLCGAEATSATAYTRDRQQRSTSCISIN